MILDHDKSASVEQQIKSLQESMQRALDEHESSLQQTDDRMTSRISDAEGHISTLEQTSRSLTSRIADSEGNISILRQTATDLVSRMGNAEGSISDVRQTATSLTTRIGTAEGNISAVQQTASGLVSTVAGKVGKNEVISCINQSAESVTISANKVTIDTSALTITRLGSSSGYNAQLSSDSLNFCQGSTKYGGIQFSSSAFTFGGDAATSILTNSSGKSLKVGSSWIVSEAPFRIDTPYDYGNIGVSLWVQYGYIKNTYAHNNPATSTTANVRLITGSGNDQYCFAETASSSARYKEDIEILKEDEFDPKRLYDLPVKQFRYKDGYIKDKDYKRPLIPGFIAEDVAEIYPAAVEYKDDNTVESWAERVLLPPMLALIQEQHKEIEELKRRIS